MKFSDPEKKSIVLTLLVVLLWSTVATAFKFGLRTLSPAKLIFIAALVSLVVLLVYNGASQRLKGLKSLPLIFWFRAALLGFVNPFLYYLVLFKAYSLLPAQVAQPINMIWPIVLSFLAVPFLGQKMNWRNVLALLISFTGVFFISSQGNFAFENTHINGVLLALGSSLIWALYWIFNVKNKKADEMLMLLLNFAFGIFYLTLYLGWKEDFKFDVNESLWAAIYVGLFETGITFILWLKAMSLTKNTARLANLIYISPFLSLLFIHFYLGEEIYETTLVGLFFIISGILFQQMKRT